MRIATRPNQRRARSNSRDSIQAPYGGWNARDSIADMPTKDAVIMDNWIPRDGNIEMRRGYETFATGMTGQIETIMQWAGPGGQEMFAAVGTEIYDVSAGGAVGAAAVTSVANAQWTTVNFSTAGGDFLVACNDASADAVYNYDGTTWTTPTLTGAPGTPAGGNFNNVMAFKSRLYFIEKASMSYWVLPVKSIAGSAVEVPLGSFTVKGGHIVAQASWTLEGGEGVDDLLATITSNGETLIFQGTDPTDANEWSMIGRFNLGRPAGRSCFEKISGDLLVLTEDGYVSLGRALRSGRANPEEATSEKIMGAVGAVMENYRNNYGWQAVLFPKASLIIINVPITTGSLYHQHVFSLDAKAWCRFTGINAGCWGFLSDDLYFGGQGVVHKFWSGRSNDGSNIDTDVQQAFSYFKTPGKIKRFLQLRAILEADGDMVPSMGVSTDFVAKEPSGDASFSGDNSATWDVAEWDAEEWAGSLKIQSRWAGTTGEGISGGLRMQLSSKNIEVKWHSTDFVYEVGDKF